MSAMLVLVQLASTVQLAKGQDDFDMSDFEMGDNFGDFGSDVDDVMDKMGGDIGGAFDDIGDKFSDLGGDIGDTFGDLGGDIGDTFGDLGGDMEDAFNDIKDSIDFDDFTGEQKERFDDLLKKAGTFTQDQIDAINQALSSNNLDGLGDMNLTEEQTTAFYSALQDWNAADGGGVGVVVSLPVLVSVVISGAMVGQ